jgi:NADH-quinone oxidoreductase subunit H
LPPARLTHTVKPDLLLDQLQATRSRIVPHPLFAAFDFFPVLPGIIGAAVLIGFLLVSAIFSVWLERKVAGRIQDRLGPTRVGGKFGWLQTLADGMKLLVKEDVIPASADQMLFRVGPYIALAGSFLAYLVLPFGNQVVASNLNVGLFFILAVMSTEVFGIILIGYGSGSKWSLFGGMREAAQMVSYEIPMAICILVPVVVAGSMNLNTVAMQQQYGVWTWNIFHDPFTFAAFWTYFTCAMASCKRAPFDLAEAESELVAGFHTEYSGFRWLVIFMAEYGSMFAVSGIALVMFLGGWSLGLPWELSTLLQGLFGWSVDLSSAWIATPLNWIGLGGVVTFSPTMYTIDFGFCLGNVINVVVFIAKGWFLVFVMMWIRWTLPRLRIDQVMMPCLKYLLPISCVLLMGVSIWQLLVPGGYFNYLLFAVCVVLLALFFTKLFTMTSSSPRSIMPGARRLSELPGYGGHGTGAAKSGAV